jgi:DNA-binding LytR/AlgR family response regulator
MIYRCGGDLVLLSECTMMVYKMDEGREKSFVCINLHDVDFIDNDGRRAVFHIGNERYFLITNKSELEELLMPRGFDILDRANLVNISKIKYFDSQLGTVYFEEKPTKKSKFATVARVKMKFVEQLIQRAIAKNNDKTLVYQPEKKSALAKLKGYLTP